MGSFLGHIFAGLVLSSVGFFFCYAAIVQFIKDQHAQKSWSALKTANMMDTRNDFVTRIFYGNPKFMIGGIILGTFFIFFVEMPGEKRILFFLPSLETPDHAVPHMFIYGSYILTAVAALLESKRYLPYTSCTWAFAIANYFSYLIWLTHSEMQMNSESMFHKFMANGCLIGASVTVLVALLQVSKQHDFLHVPAFVSFYMMIWQGLVMWCVAGWIYKWYDPFSPSHHDIPMWQPPCIFAGFVFTSLAIFGVIWNYVQHRESKKSNDAHDSDSEESLPLSTESDPLSTV